MKKLLLGENFVNSVLDNISIKDEMSSKLTIRYLMRAAMSGIIILFAYVAYIAISVHYESINFGDEELNLYQVGKFMAASFFSLALVSIYYTKSELLTSNMMITTVGVYYKKINFKQMGRILGYCFLGNFIGGLFVAILLSFSTILSGHEIDYLGELVAGKTAYITDKHYLDLLIRGIFCNFFINFSMLMVYSGNIKNDVAKIIAMYFGVFIFAYLGLEHSVANTTLFTFAQVYEWVNGVELINIGPAIANVVIVLIGNFIGGGILIGLYYAFINDGRKFTE